MTDLTPPSMERASALPSARRHDLDALRAGAMLLGVALHAALAYFDSFWPVQDEGRLDHAFQSDRLRTFVGFVHLFRMPLFFLVSGYFTAMLWRARGPRALLAHRLRRILIPLLLALVTLVPAVHQAAAWTGERGLRDRVAEAPGGGFWAAVREGDDDRALAAIRTGAVDVEQVHPGLRIRPLAWAALHDRPAPLAALLAAGAGLESRDEAGGTPLIAAAVLGNARAANALLDAGADPAARNAEGRGLAEVMAADWVTTRFIGGLVGRDLERDAVIAGRRRIAARLGIELEEALVRGPIAVYIEATRQPFFYHLWFLWFLLWYVAVFFVLAGFARLVRLPGPPRGLVLAGSRILPLALLTWLPLLVFDPALGAPTSEGVLPMPTVLFHYGVFFFFGALYQGADDVEGRLGRRWKALLATGTFVLFPLAMDLTFDSYGAGRLLPEGLVRPLGDLAQALCIWCLVFGSIGFVRRAFGRESRLGRYLSDSAYWIYLAHLPLVILLQEFLRPAGLGGPIPKWLLVTLASSGFLLAIYAALVRHSWLGRLLNGPRPRNRS